jgi:hypothetical protein
MGVDAIQLKPHQESFYVIVFEKLAPLSAVILCEGHSDAEVAKRILKKMESEGVIGRISLKVGFTDVDGRDNVPRMLDAIVTPSPHPWEALRLPRAVCRFSARKRTPHLPIGSPCLGHHFLSAGGGPPA